MKDKKLKAQFDQTISALSLIIDQFGEQNLLHCRRVAVIATTLAEIVIPEKKDIIFYASLLHDVGAVVFGEHPMMFPSMEEQKRVSCVFKHPTVSSNIISKLNVPKEMLDYLGDHHEWYDGSGYPNGKKGEDISIGAQLIRIADTIDIKLRGYKERPCTEIYNYLRLHKGREFNPSLWNAVLDLKNKDAGAFCTRISNDVDLHRIFSEILPTVEPHWITSETIMKNHMKVILDTFAEVIDAKHQYTRRHSERVAFFSEKIALSMELPQAEIEQIVYAAHLHDIGKVYVPNEILDKNGQLSNRELEILKRHVIITMEILDAIEAFRDFTPIAGFHQERYDGKGYPDGLSSDDIPLGARILGVADAVDAMLSDRAYRKALSVENTTIQLERCSGTQFDPMIAVIAIGLLNDKEMLTKMREI